MFWCQENTIPPTSTNTVIIIATQQIQKWSWNHFGLQTVFPHYEKNKKKRNKKTEKHSQHVFQPVCLVWALFFFPLFPGFLHTPPHATKRCLTSLPQTHPQPHPTPPSHCQHNSRKLGHDSEHGVVAADARPNLFVVLFGVAHLVELRLRKHKTGACQHLKYCKQSVAKDLKQEAWWKTKQLSMKNGWNTVLNSCDPHFLSEHAVAQKHKASEI